MAKKILVIDDEPDMLAILKIRLESNKYDVILAADGKEGFGRAINEKPDLIILDLMLPKADGYWVCSMLKHDKRFAVTPIIIISALSEDRDSTIAKECGADAYFTKPVDCEKLLSDVRRLLR